MKHLFCAEGESALALTMSAGPLLAFDFDGTLAPIVARPADARVPIPVAQRLRRLAEQLPVAIVSGRRVDDVRGRLGFEPADIIGNHGAEDPRDRLDDLAVQALQGFRQRLAAADEVLRRAGVAIEDKGASIALHYRLALDRRAAIDAINAVLDKLEPDLEAFDGKMVVNVVWAAANDKAGAVAALVARHHTSAAVFVGDDLNDEPVFARGEPSWLTVRIGCEDANSKARFFLHGPVELPAMLDFMLSALLARRAV